MEEEVPSFEAPQPSQTEVVAQAADRIRAEMQKVLIGQESLCDHLITALLAGGHLLIEGVPGIAKTLAVRVLSRSLNLQYSRIQFTPDLMPSDVTGTNVFNVKSSEFEFRKGPIFGQVVLIDEINRAPAKTQASLFEVMEEQTVTVDGHTMALDQPFMVLATQNPIEQEGTYRLPEAQLDRFLFRVILQYPELNEEQQILRRFRDDFHMGLLQEVQSVIGATEIQHLRSVVERVYIKDELLDYIAGIVHKTRNDADIYLGASPRASLAVLRASKARAAMAGRDFVTPDDIRNVTVAALNHRIQLHPEREMEGITVAQVIRRITESIEVPR